MTTEEKILQHIFGFYPEIGKKFRNPLRVDRKPGAHFYQKNGYIRLCDPASKYNGKNCWDILMGEKMLFDMEEARKYVATHLPKMYKKRSWEKLDTSEQDDFKCRISPIFKNLSTTECDYMLQRGIQPEHLEEDRVLSASTISFNTRQDPSLMKLMSPFGPCFVFIFRSGNIKIYMPEMELRWLGNVNQGDLWGGNPFDVRKNNLGNSLILTKGYKERRILKNFRFASMGVQGEGHRFYGHEHVLKELSDLWENIFVFYDPDRAGFDGTKALVKRARELGYKNFHPMFWPKSEYQRNFNRGENGLKKVDLDDYMVKFGNRTKELIVKVIRMNGYAEFFDRDLLVV